MRYRYTVGAALAAISLLGCADEESSEPLVAPPPDTVRTLSGESFQEALIQDVKTYRTTLDSGQFDERSTAIYELVDRANELGLGPFEVEAELSQSGAELYLAELPGLLARLEESEPQVRQRLRAARFQTEVGEKLRQIGLSLLTDMVRTFQELRDFIVAAYDPTWSALGQWQKPVSTGDVRRRQDQRLNELVKSLPPKQRKALFRAIREVYGTS